MICLPAAAALSVASVMQKIRKANIHDVATGMPDHVVYIRVPFWNVVFFCKCFYFFFITRVHCHDFCFGTKR